MGPVIPTKDGGELQGRSRVRDYGCDTIPDVQSVAKEFDLIGIHNFIPADRNDRITRCNCA